MIHCSEIDVQPRVDGRVHGVGRSFQAVVVAVPDPVGVGVDKPGVGDVLPDVDDRHLLTGDCQDLVPSPDRGNGPSSMRSASATGGSSIVTIRPTMTRLPVLGAVLGAALGGRRELLA